MEYPDFLWLSVTFLLFGMFIELYLIINDISLNLKNLPHILLEIIILPFIVPFIIPFLLHRIHQNKDLKKYYNEIDKPYFKLTWMTLKTIFSHYDEYTYSCVINLSFTENKKRFEDILQDTIHIVYDKDKR